MKKFILIVTTLVATIFANSEIGWVDEQLQEISAPRAIPEAYLKKDPFIFLDKNKTKPKDGKGVTGVGVPQPMADGQPKKEPEEVYILSAIINEKALINSSWYKKSDKIGKYTISSITNNSATLTKGKKELVLTTLTSGAIDFKNK